MRTRTRWIVAGGAAAVGLTPIAAVYGSTPLDDGLQRTGVVLDAEAANRARAERTATEAAARATGSATPTATATAAPKAVKKPAAKASVEPSGKKTVSAASPVSPRTSTSPVSPNTAR